MADNAPDYDGAIAYALSRLEAELDPGLTYHSYWHTAEDVLPAARRLAALMGVSAEDARLVEVGAAFHDVGYLRGPDEHERAGAEIAAEALPGFGFGPDLVAVVQGMIMATRLPQTPRTLLEEILVDADLDALGREDAQARGDALRRERSRLRPIEDEEWRLLQVRFYSEHHYFTPAARALRDAGKEAHLRGLGPPAPDADDGGER
jgi:uncharacterized protein